MADFEQAFQVLLLVEGGYSNDPKDPGGETKYGISKRSYPNLDIKNLTVEQAREIYLKDWWQKEYEEIQSQEIATKVLVLAVNIGHYYAHILLQRAVRAVNGVILNYDGNLGSQTLGQVNNGESDILLAAYKSEAAGYYRSLKNPHDLDGWLNRAYR